MLEKTSSIAQIRASLRAWVFRDVPELSRVRAVGVELVPHHAVLVDDRREIVVRRGSGGAGLAALPVKIGSHPGDPAQQVDTGFPDGDAVLVGQLVGEEPVAQRRVAVMELVKDVDEVVVVPVALADRVFESLVVPLGRQTQDPARHRDRHTLMRAPVAAISRTIYKTIPSRPVPDQTRPRGGFDDRNGAVVDPPRRRR
ncbi:hypothetical protein [Nocardioides aurantiacus]|uniref:hypothetical protein n=1 Tax=Nocardioides aurantiacus TaxID=86796 RepID=UPI00403F33AE